MIDMWTFIPCNGEHVVVQWSEESFINIEGNQARLLPQIDTLTEVKVGQNIVFRVRQKVQMTEWVQLRTSKGRSNQITRILMINHLPWLPGCPGPGCDWMTHTTGHIFDSYEVFTNNRQQMEVEDTNISMWFKSIVYTHVEFRKLGHLSSIVDSGPNLGPAGVKFRSDNDKFQYFFNLIPWYSDSVIKW